MLLCSAQQNHQNWYHWYLWNLYNQNKGKRKTDAVSYAQVNEAVKVIRCVCMCMFIKISDTLTIYYKSLFNTYICDNFYYTETVNFYQLQKFPHTTVG